MPNQLDRETSPYLLQHANNPVNWFPWSLAALKKALDENKPIFLSIGYAACHWCHVMAHESFEDPATARLLNEAFISIKVDREERPDLDSIYMNAVVAMTGQGGWPMSVFLTPQGAPFYGGTYFPPTRRYGMPSFREVLSAIIQAWQNENVEIQRISRELTQHLRDANTWGNKAGSPLHPETLEQAAQELLAAYDWDSGGWGRAPRFPQPMAIDFLLLQSTRGLPKTSEAAGHVLEQMSRGGMYDVVGGGFHRYSTDNSWLVPHFEKMLYDNGQLAQAYLNAYLLTGNISFRRVCEQTLDFVAREMTHPEGGFFSSLDADSDGGEGNYYIWTREEIEKNLSDPGERLLFHQIYPVDGGGNFEGKIILRRSDSLGNIAARLGMQETELTERLDAIHLKLFAARAPRPRPQTDDKVLVSWNALALHAFATAARYLQRADYLEIARKNAAFLLRELYQDGRLLRAWRNGHANHNAYLEDYAGLVLALLELYQSDPNPAWYRWAVVLADEMVASFHDPAGGFFDTRSDHESLITRPKEIQDNATPSGNALAAAALLRLGAYSEQPGLRDIAEEMLGATQDLMARHPTAFACWLQALDFAVGPVRQIAVVGPPDASETAPLVGAIWESFRPRTLVAISNEIKAEDYGDSVPGLLHDRSMIGGKTTVYVCQNFTCNLPVQDIPALKKQLASDQPR